MYILICQVIGPTLIITSEIVTMREYEGYGMARLPEVGGDSGGWGQILNDFLLQSHADNGSLKPGVVGASNLADGSVTPEKLASLAATLLAGAGIAITYDSNAKTYTFSATGASWGGIQGTLSDQTDLQTALDDKVDHVSQVDSIVGLSEGYVLKHTVNTSTAGTDPEPIIVYGRRSNDPTPRRAFWLNERGTPRGASIESEPALKLFGPRADTSYTGALFETFNRWDGSGSQQHIWSMYADGNPRLGANRAVGANIVVLAQNDPLPADLPVGTVIVRKTF